MSEGGVKWNRGWGQWNLSGGGVKGNLSEGGVKRNRRLKDSTHQRLGSIELFLPSRSLFLELQSAGPEPDSLIQRVSVGAGS